MNGCAQIGGTTAGNPIEDSSASGAAAEAAGGALSSTESGGTLANQAAAFELPSASEARSEAVAPEEQRDSCPTYKTDSLGCTSDGTALWLSLDDCNYGLGGAVWTGTLALSPSSANAACGSFPDPGANGTLLRQAVSAPSALTPSSLTVVSAFGTRATIDDASANLSNYAGATIPALASDGGYGVLVQFGSTGARTSIEIGHRAYSTGLFDYSISGTLSIDETVGATSRTISGSLTVYHNLLHLTGTTTFENVVHEDGCCVPVSGTITTSFPSLGESETLQLTGCGTGTLTGLDGSVKDVSLSRCF